MASLGLCPLLHLASSSALTSNQGGCHRAIPDRVRRCRVFLLQQVLLPVARQHSMWDLVTRSLLRMAVPGLLLLSPDSLGPAELVKKGERSR